MKNRVKFTREQVHDLAPEVAKELKEAGVKSIELALGDDSNLVASYFDQNGKPVTPKEDMPKVLGQKLKVTEADFAQRVMDKMEGRVDDPEVFASLVHLFCTGEALEVVNFDDQLAELEHSNVIRGIEIFATGEHNKQSFVEKDLDDIVNAFGKLDFKPALKIGHTKHEKGQPAYGWVTNLKRVGTKLMADFESMHDSVVEAIRKKSYDRVSSEIYFNLERAGQKFPRALRAVALLGAEVPAVAKLVPLHKIEFAAEGEVQPFDTELDVPATASIASLEARVSGITNFLQESVTMAKKNAAKIIELKEKVAQFTRDMDDMKKKGKKDDDEDMKKLKKMADEMALQIAELEKEGDEDEDAKVLKSELEKRDKRIAQLEANARRDSVAKMTEKVKVPALRPAISSLYSYGLENDGVKVVVLSQDKDGKEKKEEKSLVDITNSVVTEINRQAEKLFSVLTTRAGKTAEREEGAEDDRPIDEIVDEKVVKLQKEKPTEFKDYAKALEFVLAGDTELNDKYVASFGEHKVN